MAAGSSDGAASRRAEAFLTKGMKRPVPLGLI
jgi:hypothetical protein